MENIKAQIVGHEIEYTHVGVTAGGPVTVMIDKMSGHCTVNIPAFARLDPDELACLIELLNVVQGVVDGLEPEGKA